MIQTAEIHTEEVDMQGLSIQVYVKVDPETRNYKLTCKAFDKKKRALLWDTDLLDEKGKPQMFYSLSTAVTRSRTILENWKK